jgi:cytochrome P450
MTGRPGAPAADEDFDFARERPRGEELHRFLARLRERGPVGRVRFGGTPAWIILRHAELAEAFRDGARFPPGPAYRATTEPAVGRSFISMDGDEHRVYRRLATPAFRSGAVARLEATGLAELARELAGELAGRAEADLVASFTHRFPLRMIARLLGLPRGDEERFAGWAIGLLSVPFDPELARRSSEEFTAYLLPILAERRRRPRGDVISELAAAEVEGRRLGDEDVLSHVRLLFPTGAETTTSALGNLLFALLSEPERWKRVVEEPDERHAAVEELLRWENPVAVVPRVAAAEPVEFAGAEIPAQAPVLFCIAAAHRDPAAFADPDRFDPGRRGGAALLAFGPGLRTCPGMHLARKEMRVALDALCERFPGLRLLDRDASVPVGAVLRAPERLPVALR